ncbi:SDR family oxidoreductase [Amycolatopsis suaedae]|uniref:SDR family oxidoreductase n=1 Tax=Amycolatopsis suaedae TaxID=2510978 RepID=A0A4V2EM28_9PSEU|nr:SDR family oxidoreductase [Amycolatopsis suaedae]
MTASDGVRLAVRTTGPASAPVLVLVHGYPDNSSVWDGVVAELAGRFRVVTYDVRGAGDSDRPVDRSSYQLDRLAADLAAVVDEVQPHGRVHLLAHDWGAIQTWHAVTGDWLTGRVASYTSISGPSLDHAGAWLRTPRRPLDRLRQFLHSQYITFFQLPLLPELVWRTGLMRGLMRRLDPHAGKPETADGVHGLELYRANMVPRLSRPKPATTDVPVQVLAPAGDRFVSTPMQTEIERWVPDLRVRVVPGTHWLPRSRPEVVARIAAELVDHVEGGPTARGLVRSRAGRDRRFAGSLVVVTGAGSGIGRSTAEAFAREGAEVVVTDIDGESAEATARAVGGTAYTVDSADPVAVQRFADDVRDTLGVADIVVNNAGIGMFGSFLETSQEDWERVVNVNLWGVVYGCRTFAEQLVRRGEGGHIVNVASMAAYAPSRGLPAYATTKAAVLMLSECLRGELAEHRIGVTALCPGFVNTAIAGNTRFVGTDATEQAHRQRSAAKLYARRGFGPDGVARDLLRAVERNTAVAPSTPEAKGALLLSRLSPGLLRAIARADLTPR